MSLRIAHIIASAAPAWGGPSRVIREMTRALSDLGHQCVVFSTDSAPDGQHQRADEQPPFDPRVPHHCYRSDFPRPPYPSARFALALARAAGHFDIAHVHGLFNAPSSTAMAILRARRVPFVLRPCGMLDPWSLQQKQSLKTLWWRFIDGPNTRAAAAIQCSTQHERAGVTTALALPADAGRPRIVACPQGVDALAPPSNPLAPHPRPYALFLGRIAIKKGLLPLVAAFASASIPADLDLLLVGPDERGHAHEVAAAIARHGLAGRVHLVGPVFDPERKAQLLTHARVFCLPSSDENFGIAVVEAARFGVPLIVSPDVGLAPDIAAAHAGCVVPAESAAIADAIARAVGPDRDTFAAGARVFGNAFDWRERAVSLVALYQQVLHDTRR